MNLELVTIESTDKLMLPALLYTPDKPTKKAAIWLHGMGDSGAFYNTVRSNALGEALTANGIAFLSLNNRGAHNRKDLHIADESLPEEERYYLGGTHYELIHDCIKDIDGATKSLQGRRFTELYLIGHSSGANKICVYDAHARHNPFSKYVLAGPGDDTGLWFSDLGERKYHKALNYAHKAIKAGEALKTMPRYTGLHPFSAQSAADLLDPDGDYNTFPFYEHTVRRLGKKPLFAEFRNVHKPMLTVYGAEDETTAAFGGPGAVIPILKKYLNPRIAMSSDFQIIPEADHSYHGQEKVFAEAVAAWLNQ